MTKLRGFLYALATGMLIAALTVIGGKLFFPVWTAENLMLLAFILGGIGGLLNSFFMRWGQKKE